MTFHFLLFFTTHEVPLDNVSDIIIIRLYKISEFLIPNSSGPKMIMDIIINFTK